jgi:hypothetical protein
MLLAPYRPKRVRATTAEADAVGLLQSLGVDVSAAAVREKVDAPPSDSAAIGELRANAASPEEFHDELRMHLLAALQKRSALVDDWVSASPEHWLGGGGGGT